MPAKKEKPQGQPTRGKTAPNRLRRTDTFLILYDLLLIKETTGPFQDALFVDLGYGEEPRTTLESAARLRKHNPSLPVLGVEIDPERVAAAQLFQTADTHFRLGGFNLPLQPGETVRAIRAFNVLRQYPESEVGDAHQTLAQSLLPGGLLFEGTSDPYGRVWTANLLRKTTEGALQPEALVFSTSFRSGFEPALFQPVLPKNYIHCMIPGQPIYDFLEAWKAAALETIALKDLSLRQWFTASAENLPQHGFDIDLRKKFLNKGFLVWYL